MRFRHATHDATGLHYAVRIFVGTAVRVPLSWRIAPITAALVIASAVDLPPWGGLEIALRRTGEVLLGSATALVVTWLLSLVWKPRETPRVSAQTENAATLPSRQ